MKRVSVIIASYNRKAELRDCIGSVLRQTSLPDEIIVVDNNSTDGTGTLFAEGGEFADTAVKYVRGVKNLGAAGGKNIGIRMATGDILIIIDDDALLEPADAIAKTVHRMDREADLGILSYKVINYYSKTIQREEFPHKDKSLDPDVEFETSYFVGTGHAVRKEVFTRCGLYPEDYFYGAEELDLSFRAIDEGFRIIHFPEAVIWHMKSMKGRLTDKEKWVYFLRNRLAISYKYLKLRHLAVTAFVWGVAVWRYSGSFIVPFKGFGAFYEYRKGLTRRPISGAAIMKIKRLKGCVWY